MNFSDPAKASAAGKLGQAARKTRSNQFIKGTRTHHDEASIDKMRAEKLARRLYKYANAKGKAIDKYRMEPAQVQAGKVLIDRGKPVLQAIEQTEVNQFDKMDQAEIEEHIRALISSNPELAARLGIRPQLVQEAPQQKHDINTKAA